MKLLGPPPRGPVTDQALEGERLFQAVGCTACHTPAFVTGESPVKALSSKRFFPYSDFLLHDIGTGDGIGQGDATTGRNSNSTFVGCPASSAFSARWKSLDAAGRPSNCILGESARSRRQFGILSEAEQAALLAFLLTL